MTRALIRRALPVLTECAAGALWSAVVWRAAIWWGMAHG